MPGWWSFRWVATRSLRAKAKPVATGVLNQALGSVTNFAMAFVLLRWLSVADYGAYGMGMTVCYFYAGVGNAAVVTQLVVHYPEKQLEERALYAARMLAALSLISASILVLIGIGSLAFWAGH